MTNDSKGIGEFGPSVATREVLEWEQQYKLLFENMLDGFALHEILFDSQGKPVDYRFLAVNPAFERITGLVAQEVVGRRVLEVLPDVEPRWIDLYSRVVMTGQGTTFTSYSRSLNRHFQVNAFRTGPSQFACLFHDVTELIAAQEKLTLLASVFTHSQEAVMLTDPQNKIVEVNPAFTRITGYEAKEVLGKDPKLLSSGRQGPEFYSELWRELETHGQWQGEIWNRHKEGHIYAEILSITKLFDEQGNLAHYLAMFLDISRLKAHEAELHHIAHFDVLTGIPNRRLLQDRMQRAVARARRSGKQLAICYLDLDGFKPINDQYGHAVGDLVLIEIAQRVQGVLREVDTLARLGGDEFVLLITELTNGDEMLSVLERVLAKVSLPITIKGHTMTVSASVGVSLYPDDSCDPDTLLRYADQAMYRAKASGKNRFVFFN